MAMNHSGERRHRRRDEGAYSSRLFALRMLKAAVMNKSVEKGRDLEDAEALQVVASLVSSGATPSSSSPRPGTHRPRRQEDRRNRV